MRAVCATKLPTLTFGDNTRFRALLADLFPGISITDSVSADLEQALKDVAVAMKLDLTPQQVRRPPASTRMNAHFLHTSVSANSEKIWQMHLCFG